MLYHNMNQQAITSSKPIYQRRKITLTATGRLIAALNINTKRMQRIYQFDLIFNLLIRDWIECCWLPVLDAVTLLIP